MSKFYKFLLVLMAVLMAPLWILFGVVVGLKELRARFVEQWRLL